MNTFRRKTSRKTVVVRARKVSSTSNRSHILLQHATPSGKYKQQITSLSKNNKSLAVALQNMRCDLSTKQQRLDEVYENLNRMRLAQRKMIEMYSTIKSFIKDYDEVITLLKVDDLNCIDFIPKSRYCKLFRNKMKKVVESAEETIETDEILKNSTTQHSTLSSIDYTATQFAEERHNLTNFHIVDMNTAISEGASTEKPDGTSKNCCVSEIRRENRAVDSHQHLKGYTENIHQASGINCEKESGLTIVHAENGIVPEHVAVLESEEPGTPKLSISLQEVIDARTSELKCINSEDSTPFIGNTLKGTNQSSISVLSSLKTFSSKIPISKDCLIKNKMEKNSSLLNKGDLIRKKSNKNVKNISELSAVLEKNTTNPEYCLDGNIKESNSKLCQRNALVEETENLSGPPCILTEITSNPEKFSSKDIIETNGIIIPALDIVDSSTHDRRKTFVKKSYDRRKTYVKKPCDRRKTFVKESCDVNQPTTPIKTVSTHPDHESGQSKSNEGFVDIHKNSNIPEFLNFQNNAYVCANDMTTEQKTAHISLEVTELSKPISTENYEKNSSIVINSDDKHISKKIHLEEYECANSRTIESDVNNLGSGNCNVELSKQNRSFLHDNQLNEMRIADITCGNLIGKKKLSKTILVKKKLVKNTRKKLNINNLEIDTIATTATAPNCIENTEFNDVSCTLKINEDNSAIANTKVNKIQNEDKENYSPVSSCMKKKGNKTHKRKHVLECSEDVLSITKRSKETESEKNTEENVHPAVKAANKTTETEKENKKLKHKKCKKNTLLVHAEVHPIPPFVINTESSKSDILKKENEKMKRECSVQVCSVVLNDILASEDGNIMENELCEDRNFTFETEDISNSIPLASVSSESDSNTVVCIKSNAEDVSSKRRRRTQPVNYKEPSLHKKLRRYHQISA